MNEAIQKAGVALVVLAAILWATVGVSAQMVPASAKFAPEVLGLLRTAIAGPILLLVAVVFVGANPIQIARKDPAGLLIFAVSNAVFQIGLFRCFLLLGVTVTVFLTVCLPPVMAMVMNWMRRREPVTGGSVIALACAVAGLWLIGEGRALASVLAASSEGILTAVVASFAFVTMSGAARSLGRTASPVLVAGAGLSLSGLMLLILLHLDGAGSLSTLREGLGDPTTVLLVLYLGLGPTALAYVCYCTGIARCRSTLVALIAAMIEPAIAAALAIWILSDVPNLADLTGCTLLMIAMVILWQSERLLARRRLAGRTADSAVE